MDLKIGIGIDNIKFGMSEEDVINILGNAENVCTFYESINDIFGETNSIGKIESLNDITYFYNDKQIELIFNKDEECKLYTIQVSNPDVKLFESKIIGNTKDQLIKFLNDNGNYEDFIIEVYDTFEVFLYEELNVTFYFEKNILTKIDFSPLYIDENTISWP